MYTKEYFEDNIEEVFESMGWQYFWKHKDWYWEYHNWCNQLAKKVGIAPICVCGVFSALSPQTSLKQNKIITELYFQGVNRHTGSQIAKADKIASMYGYVRDIPTQMEQIEQYLNGLKTRNFFRALYNPLDPTTCVIDRHALHIAGWSKNTVTVKQYNIIKDSYLSVAERLKIIGNELQASTWNFWRQVKFNHHKYD